MAVDGQTQRHDAATGSPHSKRAHPIGTEAGKVARRAERIVKDTVRVGAEDTDKMLETTKAAIARGTANSQKIAKDAREFAAASVPLEMRQDLSVAMPMVDGIQSLQQTSAEYFCRYIERSVQAHRQLLQSRSLPETSLLQRQYFLETIRDFVDVSRSIIDISASIAQQSTGRFTDRLAGASDRFQHHTPRS